MTNQVTRRVMLPQLLLQGYTKNELIWEIRESTGRLIESRQFDRWRKAAIIPAKRQYSQRDKEKLLYIGLQLNRGLSLDDAHECLKALIESNNCPFTEEG